MTPRQQSILIGALVTGILSTSYLGLINFVCCLGIIIGGVVAAQQYASRTGNPLNSGDGAVLGALAGAGGAVLTTIFDRALRPLNLDSGSISQSMMQNLGQMDGQQGMSPEMMQQFQGGGSTAVVIVGLVVGIIVNAIFGAIGGAIGAAIFGEDEQEQGGPPESSAQPGDSPSRGPEAGSSESGGAQSNLSDGPQDASGDGSESNRDGSV